LVCDGPFVTACQCRSVPSTVDHHRSTMCYPPKLLTVPVDLDDHHDRRGTYIGCQWLIPFPAPDPVFLHRESPRSPCCRIRYVLPQPFPVPIDLDYCHRHCATGQSRTLTVNGRFRSHAHFISCIDLQTTTRRCTHDSRCPCAWGWAVATHTHCA
jgi:hypothetical protein